MAISGVESLSTKNLLKLCQKIYLQFEYDSSLKHIEGLLRISGSQSATDKIIDSGEIPKITKFNVHTVLDVVKRVLPELNSRLSALAPEFLFILQESRSGSILEMSNALDEFINNMVASQDLQKEIFAEILYGYIHLGAMFSGSGINKMSIENCAIVLGPNVNDMLGWFNISDSNLHEAATKLDVIKKVIFTAIESKKYDKPYIEKYAKTLLDSRKKSYEIVCSQIAEVKYTIAELVQQKENLMDNISRITHQVTDLEKAEKKSQGMVTKDYGKEIKSIIQSKKNELIKLEQKVSALEPYINEWIVREKVLIERKNDLKVSIDEYRFISVLNGDVDYSFIDNHSDALKSDPSPMLPLYTHFSDLNIFAHDDSINPNSQYKYLRRSC